MEVKLIRSDEIYEKIMMAPQEKKTEIYRYELMMPFEKKWACYNIPMKAPVKGGYDVIMASSMLGHLSPSEVDETKHNSIKLISDNHLWSACKTSFDKSLNAFCEHGIELPVKEYLFTILLANPDSPYIKMCDGYCGEGGIPGYIMVWLTPNGNTIKRLPAAVAHEINHNVRFQFIKWRNDITLGEMIVSEGLAENFAVQIHGEEKLGPWVTKTDANTLNHVIKPVLCDSLGVQGLVEMNAYLYGDEMAKLQSYTPVGMPYCAGYACGYYLIRHYLKKTGKSIIDATILSADEILADASDFWNTETVI